MNTAHSLSSSTAESIGIQLIDREHREIFDLIMELNFHAARGRSHSLQIRLLKELERFTLSHFALEEGMMEAVRFPGRDAHRNNHRRLIRQLQQSASGWTPSDGALITQPTATIWQAHSVHMDGDDLAFGRWINGDRPAPGQHPLNGSLAA